MTGCDHNCDSCASKCEKKDFLIHTNEHTSIRKTIGIVSGKGGVGKSFVTTLLAVNSSLKGYKAAILDGDILGPSIPKAFGIHQKAFADETGKFIYPANSGKLNIDVISSNMLLDDETDPVIWRASIVTSILKQFYTDVIYGEQDVLFIDMPPGTGDVVLTTFQSIPLDGIIIVTSPQDLVSMIVTKAVKMANLMNIPILGLVENYSYVKCPCCDEKIKLFGDSKVDELAYENNIKNVVKLPINPEFTEYLDVGLAERCDVNYFDEIIEEIFSK